MPRCQTLRQARVRYGGQPLRKPASPEGWGAEGRGERERKKKTHLFPGRLRGEVQAATRVPRDSPAKRPPRNISPDPTPPATLARHRPPSFSSLARSLRGGGGRTLGTERKKGGLGKAEETEPHTGSSRGERKSEGESGVCVSVCASAAWASGCRSQGAPGSAVRPRPRAAPAPAPPDYNSQSAASPGGEE